MLLIGLGDSCRTLCLVYFGLGATVEKPPLTKGGKSQGSAILAAKPMMSSKKRPATGFGCISAKCVCIVGAMFVWPSLLLIPKD
jgi:hypothetical protein